MTANSTSRATFYDRDQPLVPAMAGAAMPDPEALARARELVEMVRELTGD